MQGITGMPYLNDYSGLTAGQTQKHAAQAIPVYRHPVPPAAVKPPATEGPLPPVFRHWGPLPPEMKLSSLVRDYRTTVNAEHADLVAQLKDARETLKEAQKARDTDAIAEAQKSVAELEQKIQANRDSLTTLHDDVALMRELRQQLASDVKSGNLETIQQDREAIEQQRQQIRTDVQA